jgi:hypothetical protein
MLGSSNYYPHASRDQSLNLVVPTGSVEPLSLSEWLGMPTRPSRDHIWDVCCPRPTDLRHAAVGARRYLASPPGMAYGLAAFVLP